MLCSSSLSTPAPYAPQPARSRELNTPTTYTKEGLGEGPLGSLTPLSQLAFMVYLSKHPSAFFLLVYFIPSLFIIRDSSELYPVHPSGSLLP